MRPSKRNSPGPTCWSPWPSSRLSARPTLSEARLEEAGIKVIIPDEEYFLTGPLEPEEMPEIHLLINQSDTQAALKILEREPEWLEEDLQFVDEAGAPLLVEEEPFPEEVHPIEASMRAEVTCTWCGSYKVGQTFPLPFISRKWKCRDCGQVWDKA